ncbi:ATP-binding domain-containing protein [Streptomyces sp. 35G-GA-8]|uniref:HelD family protein n=1 Tax=Streptomyces sp. 35G-GA-8 TaxID=2939434 RepID=UPI00201EF313|nr:ATP-binding domain-containing protein [Streptomyces sp. 35G-GA-8]MCL7380304.1 ATP-binding domain-containing protein [Streptomyces sp. 35G-GA-8]
MNGERNRELDRELDRERTYHETCRAALTGMVDDAHEQVVTGENAFASGADAEVLGRHLRSRAKELRLEPDSPLFFGRLDFGVAPDGDHSGQSYHIGRRRISEHPSAPPLVIDWRAPVSRAFYRASARDPQGVTVRRRFGWAPWSKGAPEDLTSLEDERLTAERLTAEGLTAEGLTAEGSAPGSGPGSGPGNGPGNGAGNGALPARSAILTGEIERPRVGPMRDIAATIQPEQDDLVRSDLTRSVCVQGAPGTGKTAVGLHRAAYLLYTYPRRIQRGGLLILGPNRTFLSYISEVLPTLGEIGIRQSTVGDEIARHPVRAEDPEAAAVVKHDARMAEVLRRALYGRVAAPAEPLTVPDGSYRWRLGLDELARIVAEVRAEAPPYALGRERVRSRAVREIQLRAERRAGPQSAAWVRRVAGSRAVTAYLDTVWPKAAPEEVLAALLADPESAAEGILTPEERRAIQRARRSARTPSARTRAPSAPPLSARAARRLPWSAADLVLLDELAGLIEHPEGYGHIVIDEAQDLSPMECRAIARRAEFGSLTVLGDLAQGTTPWAARSWPELLAHLGRPDATVTPLTTGFRVPGAVVELANRLLASLDVDVPPARSLRGDGELTVRQVPEVGDLAGAVTEAVRKALTREGSIGVIAADPEAERLRTVLTAAGIATATPDELGASAARVAVLPATAAKGLEYDHVVLVEPVAIAEAEARGRHRLYVALTRAVSRLDIVHSRPLPAVLGTARSGPSRSPNVPGLLPMASAPCYRTSSRQPLTG